MTTAWMLQVGDPAIKTELLKAFGGSGQRGIAAPAIGSGRHDIMLFWGEEEGGAFGYEDGWAPDGIFFFTGTGQRGDQDFEAPTSENGRVRDHVANGDRLRLLQKLGPNQVTYLGEFRLAEPPFEFREARDADGLPRRIIQFRLVRVAPTQPA